MLNLVIGAVIQESDCRTGTAAGADSTTVSGQLTDTLLQVNGNQVAQQYCTQHFFFACSQCMCINNNRNRSGNTLVAAAGGNYYRKLAAVHTRVTACSSAGTCADTQAVRIAAQQNLADACTVIIGQAFFRNSHIEINLALQQMFYII